MNALSATAAAIGMMIDLRAEQSSKAPPKSPPMEVMEAGRSMCSRDEHLQKVPGWIDEIEFGRVTEVKNLQLLKRYVPRDVAVLGIMMERNELRAKA